MSNIIKTWWKWLRYAPTDPRFNAGGVVKIAVIGGGTGLANLLRGLKAYSSDISAIVTVADAGGSTGEIRQDFDMVAPGDIRKCISALAYDEDLIAKIFEHRFDAKKKTFGGHTLGNIWITGLTDYLGSFERAIEVTSEIFQTAGRVLPSTLANIDLVIEYADNTICRGESHLDKELKKIKRISLNKPKVKAYKKAEEAILSADLIVLGPGSLYGSLVPNLLIHGIREAIAKNKTALRVYVANCSTERTQTRNFTIDDHIREIKSYGGRKLFDYVLVNSKIIRTSSDEAKLGEINNITTLEPEIEGIKIILADVIDEVNPLFHNSNKLAKELIELYNENKRK
ncbi:MAG: YvcK family protein [Candidatus Berkelbacteria bacterium]|nr:YvcK family protein [Candidatus Berkelbacteria bacterium]